jgi:hypothetical protein
MSSTDLVRRGGLAAVLGGALFVVSALLIASMPQGCIGDECELRPIRENGVAGWHLMLALLLVVMGAAGLVVRVRRAGGSLERQVPSNLREEKGDRGDDVDAAEHRTLEPVGLAVEGDEAGYDDGRA